MELRRGNRINTNRWWGDSAWWVSSESEQKICRKCRNLNITKWMKDAIYMENNMVLAFYQVHLHLSGYSYWQKPSAGIFITPFCPFERKGTIKGPPLHWWLTVICIIIITKLIVIYLIGWHGAAVGNVAGSQFQDSWFSPDLGLVSV